MTTTTIPATATSRVHHCIIHGLIENGSCPSNAELARTLDMSAGELEEALRELDRTHGLVLHPHASEAWVVHPFSTTPTMHWIQSRNRSWWAPCVWCALGVAALVKGQTEIHSSFGGEADSFVMSVIDGEPTEFEAWVHFAIPPVRAWQNVHQHCSLVLAFRTRKEIQDWCLRYKVRHGEDVNVNQVARLAKLWYGTHADADWHKWTIPEAQAIFRNAGLVSEFWDLREQKGSF